MNDELTRVEESLRATLAGRAGHAPSPGDMFGALHRHRRRQRAVTAAVVALAVAGAVTVPTLLLRPADGTVATGGPGASRLPASSTPSGLPLSPTTPRPTTSDAPAPATRMGHLSWGVGWLPPGLSEVGRKAGSVNTIRTWGDGRRNGWLVRLIENAGRPVDPDSAGKVTVHGQPAYLSSSYLGAGSRSLLWTEAGRDFGVDVRAPAGTPDRDAAARQAAVRIAESLRPQEVTLATPLTADVPPGYAPYEADVQGSEPARWAADVAFGTRSQSVHVAVGRGGAQPNDVLASYDCGPGTAEPQRFSAGGQALLWWPTNSGHTGSLLTTDGAGGRPVSVCATDPSLTRGQLARVLVSARVTVATYDWIGG
jgi:hypothetical protein